MAMVFLMKFFCLFTLIFAINFLSVNCVYKKNCTKTCTVEEAWLNDFTKSLPPGPRLPIEFDSTFAESPTPPPSNGGLRFSFVHTPSLKLKIEGDYLVAYYENENIINYPEIWGGFLPQEKQYNFHSAYFNIAPLYSESAGTSYGNGGNPQTGPPILVTLYYFKFDKFADPEGVTGPAVETDRDTWYKLYLTIGVTGVVDNPLVAPLIEDIKNIGATGTTTTVGNVLGAFYAQIETANFVFYTPDQDTRPGKTHANNAIGLYFDVLPTATISYAQWQEFAKLKNNDGEPLSHIEEFFPMYDCLPIGQIQVAAVRMNN